MSTPPFPYEGAPFPPPLPPGGVPPFPPGGVPPLPPGPQPWPVPPQYGPGFSAAYPPGFYPPPPPKRPPGKFWYAIGAGLIVVGLVLGAVVGIGGLFRAFGAQPQDDAIFSSRGSITVPLEPGTRKVLYVANSSAVGGHPINCVAAGTRGGRVSLKRYDGNLTLNQWQAMFTLEATQSGDYNLSCAGDPSDTFGVGGYLSPAAFIVRIAMICVGFPLALAGTVIMIVTAVLRRRRNQVPGW